MRKIRAAVPFVLAVIWFASLTGAQELPTGKPEEVGLSGEKLGRIGPALKALIDDHKIAGAITMVARHGRVVYFEAVGRRDVEAGKPMERDTISRIYSMSKLSER